jgi:hypothetical protein
MWGFFWRGLIYSIACILGGAVVGGIVGAIIGGVMGATGASGPAITRVTQVIGFLLGMTVGLVGLRFYIAWLLRSRYGKLRLAVVRDEVDSVAP